MYEKMTYVNKVWTLKYYPGWEDPSCKISNVEACIALVPCLSCYLEVFPKPNKYPCYIGLPLLEDVCESWVGEGFNQCMGYGGRNLRWLGTTLQGVMRCSPSQTAYWQVQGNIMQVTYTFYFRDLLICSQSDKVCIVGRGE